MTPDKLSRFWGEFSKELKEARKWAVVPNVLYHYTSLANFAAILSEQRFWASNVRFLNDRGELDYTLGLLSCVFDAVRDAGMSPQCWEILNALESRIVERAGTYDVYVVCFSEADDAKTIWMSYGAADAVAIGLDAANIRSAWQNRGPIVQRVIYKRDDQQQYLVALLKRGLSVVNRYRADFDADDDTIRVVTLNDVRDISTHRHRP
jgi:hypothetical protein